MPPKFSKTESITRTHVDVREGKQRASSPQRSIDHELISRQKADQKSPEDHTPSAKNFAMGCLSRICSGSRAAVEQVLDRIELPQPIQTNDIYQVVRALGVTPEHRPDSPLQKHAEPTELLETGGSGNKPVERLTLQEEELPENYPQRYVRSWKLKDGIRVTLRPAHPQDESRIEEFYKTLSGESRYSRWGSVIKVEEHLKYLKEACKAEYDQKMTIVTQTEEGKIIGVGELINDGGIQAEIAFTIADEYQRQGLGNQMMSQLINIARSERSLWSLIAHINAENQVMQHICEKNNFRLQSSDGGTVTFELKLRGSRL
jgi:RimJ/RimL family protein N-acetyltransferase